MPIQKVKIENYTVFENLEVNFIKGVNVFIGENGTGKTHLMKLLYAACESVRVTTQKPIPKTGQYEPFEVLTFLYELYANYINLPPHDKSLIRHNKEHCQLRVCVVINDTNYEFGIKFTETTFDFTAPLNILPINTKMQQAVFVPSTEMLSHSKGFLNLNQQFHLPFDKTQTDIIAKAGLPEQRELPDTSKNILAKINNAVDGTLILEDDQYAIKKNNGIVIPFSAEAEGHKKFALIHRLIKNGSINNKTVLFWDEPEANINPKLIPELVDILYELEKMDVQIFIATHDYILAKYLDIRKTEKSKIVFHSLYESKNGVKSEENESFSALENNSIIGQSIALYKEEVKKVMA